MGGIGVWLAFAIVGIYATACERPEVIERVIEALKGE